MARACHPRMPAKYRREGLKSAYNFADGKCWAYPIKHGPKDGTTGALLSKEEQDKRTKARIRDAASRFSANKKSIPAADRNVIEGVIKNAMRVHGIGTPKERAWSLTDEQKKRVAALRSIAARPQTSDQARRQLLAEISKIEGGIDHPTGEPMAKSKNKKAAKAKSASKAKPKKSAAKKASPAKKKTSAKAAPKAAKKASPKKAKAKSAAKKSTPKAVKKAQSSAVKAEKKAMAAEKKAIKAEKKVVAAEARAVEAEKKAIKKESAPKKGKKKGAKKAKAKAAPKAKASSKKKGGKKKAAKKGAKKAKAAPKAKASSKKKGGKKKAAKKAAPKAAAAPKSPKKKAAKKGAKKAKAKAAPKAKASSKKKGGKKKAAKKGATKRTSKTTFDVDGRNVPESVKKAVAGAKKVKSSLTVKKGNRTIEVNHRFANPNEAAVSSTSSVWGAYAVMTGGAVLGYVAAELTDRGVATRAQDAKYPWYSTDAAARIMLRPDGMRLMAQAAVTVAFFAGSLLAHKSMPMLSHTLAGAAIGAGAHVLGQIVITRLLPKISPVVVGNERNFGARFLPMEQDAVQNPEAQAIAAEDANWKTALGQQDGSTAGTLPDSYKYPASSTATATSNTAAQQTPQQGGRVPGALASGPQGRPTIQYPKAKPSQPQQRVQATRSSKQFVGEPVAGPAMRTKPLSTLGCGSGTCGKCGQCNKHRRPDADIDNGFSSGVNVRSNGSAVPGAGPLDDSDPTAMPAGIDTSVAQPDTSQPGTMTPQGQAMANAVSPGGVAGSRARTRGPQGPNGRPLGSRRLNAEAALLSGGKFNHNVQSHMGGFRVGGRPS